MRLNGAICGCVPEYTEDDFAVNNELSKLMLMEDSDHYDTFSESERSELIFRLFKHLILGGKFLHHTRWLCSCTQQTVPLRRSV